MELEGSGISRVDVISDYCKVINNRYFHVMWIIVGRRSLHVRKIIFVIYGK